MNRNTDHRSRPATDHEVAIDKIANGSSPEEAFPIPHLSLAQIQAKA